MRKPIGRDREVELLSSLLREGYIPPIILLGNFGVGKSTTLLHVLSDVLPEKHLVLKLKHPDVLFISSQTPQPYGPRPEDYDVRKSISIEQIRKLSLELAKPPRLGNRRFVVFMDANQMTMQAQNALLKTLEEHKENTIFLLITSNIYKLAPTIRSRCMILRFGNLDYDSFIRYEHPWKNDPKYLYEVSGGSIGLAKIMDSRPLQFWKESISNMFEAPSVRIISEILETIRTSLDLLVFIYAFRYEALSKFRQSYERKYMFALEDSYMVEDMLYRYSSNEVLLHTLFKSTFEFTPAL